MKNRNWLVLPLLCLVASPLYATRVGVFQDEDNSDRLQHEDDDSSREGADHRYGHDRQSRRGAFFTDRFSIEQAGTWRVYLDDLEDEALLADFNVKITTGNHHYFGRITGENDFLFEATPGEYDVSIWAKTGHGMHPDDLNIRIAANTALVPVPAAAWLFGSGLIGLIGAARRKTV